MDGQAISAVPQRHALACPGRVHTTNPLTLGLTVASTSELLAGARLGHARRRATMAAALLYAARRSSWRLPVLSAALAGASLDIGSTRAPRASALVRFGVLATLLREAMRIESWERT
jgi:hypothetical protein